MTAFAQLEKSAARWDKLWRAGKLGADSISRLGNKLPGVGAAADDVKSALQNVRQVGLQPSTAPTDWTRFYGNQRTNRPRLQFRAAASTPQNAEGWLPSAVGNMTYDGRKNIIGGIPDMSRVSTADRPGVLAAFKHEIGHRNVTGDNQTLGLQYTRRVMPALEKIQPNLKRVALGQLGRGGDPYSDMVHESIAQFNATNKAGFSQGGRALLRGPTDMLQQRHPDVFSRLQERTGSMFPDKPELQSRLMSTLAHLKLNYGFNV